jgi:hypothetical protein
MGRLERGALFMFGRTARAVLTDPHFLVPAVVLIVGIVLLAGLH